MKRIPIPTIITVGLLVLVLLGTAFTYQVRFNEAVVKVRLGKADEGSVVTEPGLKLRWPPPIETTRAYDMRLRVLDTPEAETKTADNQNIIVSTYAVWRIAQPLEFYKRVETVEKAEEQLRARINEARQSVLGRVSMSSLVNLDPQKVRYDEIERSMLEACRDSILRDYGILVDSIGIRRISLPERATEKVFDAMGAARERAAAELKEAGAAAAKRIESEAQANADKIMSFAQARAQEIEAEGIRASRRILERIENDDREFFLFLRKLEALKKLLAQRTTLFFDTSHELFQLYYDPRTPTVAPAIEKTAPELAAPPEMAPAGGEPEEPE